MKLLGCTKQLLLSMLFCIFGLSALVSNAAELQSSTSATYSEWGPQDQIGAANRITEKKVRQAAKLIKKGKRYSLGHEYYSSMPLCFGRIWEFHLKPTIELPGQNHLTFHEATVFSEIGQVGTQFDNLGHIGRGDVYYNGNLASEIYSPEGLLKLGMEHVPPFFTRGVLIDIARYKGVAILDSTYEITRDDIKGALKQQKLKIKQGDAVLIHTGWGALFVENNSSMFCASAPGIGIDAADYLIAKKVALVGSDNWSLEVIPNPDPCVSSPVHQKLITDNGIYIFETLNTAGLAQDQVYEFAFSYGPLKIRGGAGSPGSPIAIY